MNHDPHINPYTIAKLRNMLKLELHQRAGQRFNKKQAFSDIKELLIEYLKKEKLVENGIISEFLLREIEQAARSVVRGAQLQILTDDMLSLTKKEDSK